MAKDTYYFPHDLNARHDPKLQHLHSVHGHAGKGLFWDIIELMYEQDGKLDLSQCKTYAFALRADCDMLNSIINDFDLFKKDDKIFWSESVNRRLDNRKEKSLKASLSAKKRWGDANALPTDSDGNARKGKERKGKESNNDTNVSLFTEKQKSEFLSFQKWTKTNTPSLSEMKEPVTIDQYFVLVGMNYTKRQLTDMCERMHNNTTLLKKYKSAFITLKNWMKDNAAK